MEPVPGFARSGAEPPRCGEGICGVERHAESRLAVRLDGCAFVVSTIMGIVARDLPRSGGSGDWGVEDP